MAQIKLPDDFGEGFASSGGPEFEAHLRAAGVSLPAGITGADLLRAVFQGLVHDPSTQEAAPLPSGQQFALSPIVGIIRELEVEVPAGTTDPTFRALLLQRVTAWAATKRRPGTGEAASA